MRVPGWLQLCGLLVLAACAEAPLQPAAPPAPGSAAADATAAAIGEHRQLARRHAQAGDHAAAAREWHIVLLLAPGDDAARKERDVERAAIRQGVRDNLQAGLAAARNGESERATQAMLKVLALDPENAEAAKVLREIDRQKLARIQANQAQRAARENQTNAVRTAPGPAMAAESSESYDLEQPIEMFKAGDINGGLRDFRAFVDANPRNDAARQRIATLVYERGVESEQKGSHEQALMLVDQAASLRGKPVPEWSARAQSLRKAISADYYDRGVQAYRNDVAGAIKLWETSLKYDPQNRLAQAKLSEARTAQDKLKRIERDAKPK
jgi:tetratricopeptide (TPR) repeat protein